MLEVNFEAVLGAARRLRGRGVPFSDLVQEGALALFAAIDGVRSNDVGFENHAASLVEERLADLVDTANEESIILGGLLERASAPDEEALALEAERIEKAHALLAMLGRDEARVVKLRFGIDAPAPSTQAEAAGRLGIKRGRLSRLESKALVALRRAAHRLRWAFPR